MAAKLRGSKDEGKDNYPYACARVKARKSSLIPRSQYEKFLMMDLQSIIRYISETEYSKEISELGTKYSGLDLVEMATYESLARNFREVLSFCRGNLKTIVEKYLTTWDTWNIKTVLRGKSYGATPDEIMENLVPAGTFSREDLKDMVTTEKIDDIADHLKGTKFHKPLMEARSAGGEVDLMKFENALDKEYYTDLLTISTGNGWVRTVIDNFVREKIDIANLKTLFKLKFAELEPEYISSFMVPGGHELSVPEMKRLAATEDFEHFLNELKVYKFWPAIKDQAETAADTGTLNRVMSALDSYHFRNASKFGKLYPLSFLPFLDYFIWKRIEVDNIRIICRGKQAGLSEELIRSMLIT
jgi:V/A-type H+/Na+-transporting ATPase subunit C